MMRRVRTGGLPALLALVAACATAGPEPGEPDRRPVPEEPPEEEAGADVLRIGAILPETGSATMREYGLFVRQGIDIALSEDGRDVELIVLDDAGDPARAAELTRRLEERGVLGIVGPLLGASVDAAAASRPDPALAIVSPTSSDPPRGANAYTLNAGDDRGSEALARYATASGIGPVALLYPNEPEFREQAAAFRRAFEAEGGRIAADLPWEPGTTTFAAVLDRLRDSGARVAYIPADERDIRQLAPQIAYYGLGSLSILGSEAWASEAVLRGVEPAVIEGVVVAVPFLPTSSAVAWDEFVGRYEAAQRRSLDNPYPALGYDATRLLLSVLEERSTRRGVADRLAAIEDFRGATGVLSLSGGTVSRRPFLVRIRNGRTEPIDTGR